MTVVNPSAQLALGLAAFALVACVLQGREDRALAERPRREQPPVDVKAERRHHHQRKRPADVVQAAAGQPRPEVFGNFGLGLIEFGRARTITPRRGEQREYQSRHADQKNDCRNEWKAHRIADCGLRQGLATETQSHREGERKGRRDRKDRAALFLSPSISLSLHLCVSVSLWLISSIRNS